MDDPIKYPNFYRPWSVNQEADGLIDFANIMEWREVAIIANAQDYDITKLRRFLSLGPSYNVSAGVVEIFDKDPSEAVKRIKQTGIRVIIAMCYLDICPLIACQAYQQQLYGPRITWIFPSLRDIINSQDTPECTKAMRKEFELGTFYYVVNANPDDKMSIGLTMNEFLNFSKTIPGFQTSRFQKSVHLCMDTLAAVAYILHSTEKKLQTYRTSLRHVLSNDSQGLVSDFQFYKMP